MNEIERAIKTIEHISDLDTKHHLNISNYDLLTAIEALREKAERKKGCEWCCDEIVFDGEDMELELLHPLKNESRMVYPRFCPMCGRKLGED